MLSTVLGNFLGQRVMLIFVLTVNSRFKRELKYEHLWSNLILNYRILKIPFFRVLGWRNQGNALRRKWDVGFEVHAVFTDQSLLLSTLLPILSNLQPIF